MKWLSSCLFCFLSFIVLPAQKYPDNIFADSAYAPFFYGVASGDPMQDKVIIWTKVEPPTAPLEDVVTLTWQMASDSAFVNIIQKGEVAASKRWKNVANRKSPYAAARFSEAV
jgi:alkaline phosphatase D